MEEKNLLKYIEIAYKKFKNNVFFDKSAANARNRIMAFEKEDIEKKLNKIAKNIETLNDENWLSYRSKILKTIGVSVLPKKLNKIKTENNYIINKDINEDINIEEFQYMIDISIEGHVLGVLWIILIGRYLDNKESMYKYSYGNRLRRTIFDDNKDVSYYPGLFESYFSQYTTWRDKSVEIAQKELNDGNDVIILTMDFKRFYYSVNYTREEFEYFFDIVNNKQKGKTEQDKIVLGRLNDFIYAVIEEYSRKLHDIVKDENLWEYIDNNKAIDNNVLPIGFLPSCILANMRLDSFDKHVITRWNPLYYGRYVDDIIIVDKIDKKSLIYNEIFINKCSADEIIKYFLSNCNATKCNACVNKDERALLLKYNYKIKSKGGNLEGYYINPYLLGDFKRNSDNFVNGNSMIRVQKNKVKLFVFCADSSDQLLECFKLEILKNSSEFRFLPEADIFHNSDFYNKLFNLNYKDSVNKLNSVSDISLNKFELSKFLGKQMTIDTLTNGDSRLRAGEIKYLKKILTPSVLIENYLLWERLLEMILLKNSTKDFGEFVGIILAAIFKVKTQCKEKTEHCQNTLFRILVFNMNRVLALIWGKDADEILDLVWIHFKAKCRLRKSAFINIIKNNKKQYCKTRMINKYLVPISLEWIFNTSSHIKLWELNNHFSIRLFRFEDLIQLLEMPNIADGIYKYSPTTITPQEINFAILTTNLKNCGIIDCVNDTRRYYLGFNYNVFDKHKNDDYVKVCNVNDANNTDLDLTCLSVKNSKKLNFRIGVANTKIYNENLKKAIEGFPNRSLERYAQFENILRCALKEKVDMLVFPENYLPYEWIPRIMSCCAKNQMALVTGVEHLILSDNDNQSNFKGFRVENDKFNVYNLTAVILPYKMDVYKYASLTLHNKIYLSPGEKDILKGYNLNLRTGRVAHLFHWHDIWFTVHCCFELASVQLRQSFFKYPDLIIGIEHNKDIFYYSSIIESLCRDMHCYCVQVNSSDYGDSRITQPTKSVLFNIMCVKGGINNIVMISEFNIGVLREFQLQQHSLQLQDRRFKPTPPGFDTSIVYNKIHGLLEDLINDKTREKETI